MPWTALQRRGDPSRTTFARMLPVQVEDHTIQTRMPTTEVLPVLGIERVELLETSGEVLVIELLGDPMDALAAPLPLLDEIVRDVVHL